ncbi:MAG TPA: helix-turn-helix transcriptional regulator [Kineosporiaceae bacterium]|nr:helix-turn-helix transcriptional regulator [Kineosporiaceae bacterium]
MLQRIEIRRAEDLGLAVSEARRAVGLTQVRLAEQSGVERTYLAKLEAGMTTLLLDRTLRLLRRLGARLVVELPDVERPERAGSDQGPGER